MDNAMMYVFQFHKGSIKTIGYQPIAGYELKFQFHKGSIKTIQLLKPWTIVLLVSIPQRFD